MMLFSVCTKLLKFSIVLVEFSILTTFLNTKSVVGLVCYNCTNCFEAVDEVTCTSESKKCAIATGYLTNGTFQMIRSCTDLEENLYDWSSFRSKVLNGVTYNKVRAITCLEDRCNYKRVDNPSLVNPILNCYECINCHLPTPDSICNESSRCFVAAGLLFNGSYQVVRSCATSEVGSYESGMSVYQGEFKGSIYNYVWLRTCRNQTLCNDDVINYSSPFDTDSYFDFQDTALEDSSSHLQCDRMLTVLIFLILACAYHSFNSVAI